MRSLTVQNAKYRCRACLAPLAARSGTENGAANAIRAQLVNDIASHVRATTTASSCDDDGKWLQLMREFVHDVCDDEPESDDYPQKICSRCVAVLQGFDEWRKQALHSAEALQTVFNELVAVEGKLSESEVNAEESSDCRPDDEPLLEIETVLLIDPFHTQTPRSTDGSVDTTEAQAGDDNARGEESRRHRISTDISIESDCDAFIRKPPAARRPPLKSDCPPRTDDRRKSPDAGRRRRKAAAFKCQQCKCRFAYEHNYEAHIRAVHEGYDRPYPCDQCDKSYKRLHTLRYHKYVAHELAVPSYSCTDCGKSYKTEASLKQHRLELHRGRMKGCVCEQCGAAFAEPSSLALHCKVEHSGNDLKVKSFECSECMRSFQNPYTLNYHRLRYHSNERECECPICGAGFAKRFMLVAHMRSHTRDEEKYPCDKCGRLFTQKCDVIKHVRVVHLKIKPFACPHCSESFATAKTLRHHIYTHTGEKPYVCDICNKAFRQPTSMKMHRMRHAADEAPDRPLEETEYFTADLI